MRFATDSALGKLGRQLRAAGFDTLCQHQVRCGEFFEAIDTRRVILTRTTAVIQRYKDRPLLFIRDNDPLQQMVQVVGELDISRSDLKPFSRCLACNMAVVRVDRDVVKGRVPDYVWHHHQVFHRCDTCGRIYWAGSHHERTVNRLEGIINRRKK
jgi:uncharacterized protein